MNDAMANKLKTDQKIFCEDGYPICLSLQEVDEAINEPRGLVVLGSALGVPHRYYRRFADFLAANGYHCISFDYRGTGASLAPVNPFSIRLQDWGLRDMEAVMRFAENWCKQHGQELPVHYVGHSIGGQLIGLSPTAARQLNSLTFVAASMPYWRRWSFPDNLKMWLVARLALPVVSSLTEQFPSSLVGLGSMKIPSTAVKSWANWMTRPDYFFNSKFDIDTGLFPTFTQPLLSWGFVDDPLAPEANIRCLLDRFSNAGVTHRQVNPKSLGQGIIGHAGFFKTRFQDSLWRDTLNWIQESEPSWPS